jgi:hypothetical protein
MGAGGPKVTLTRFKAQQIIKAVLAGNYLETAASSLGIPRATLFNWLQIGRELKAKLEGEVGATIEVDRAVWEAENQSRITGKTVDTLAHIRERGKNDKYWVCVELLDGVEKAKAMAEMKAVQKLVKHGDKNWRAALAYLERTNHEKWGRKDRVELSGPQGGPIPVAVVMAQMSATLENLSDEQFEGAAKLVESMATVSAVAALPDK